jgi:hypothetical protein
VEKKGLTSGVHASARGEREGADDGRREIKKKTACAKYAKAGVGWPAGPRRVGPVGRLRPGKWQAGWAEVRVGRLRENLNLFKNQFLGFETWALNLN